MKNIIVMLLIAAYLYFLYGKYQTHREISERSIYQHENEDQKWLVEVTKGKLSERYIVRDLVRINDRTIRGIIVSNKPEECIIRTISGDNLTFRTYKGR